MRARFGDNRSVFVEDGGEGGVVRTQEVIKRGLRIYEPGLKRRYSRKYVKGCENGVMIGWFIKRDIAGNRLERDDVITRSSGWF